VIRWYILENMNLYLKYRPKTIAELDLVRVREAMQRIVASNKIAHAYLFTGPRGAGKTSSARILARVVNCENNSDKLAEPCNECSTCREILSGSAVDVIEIDAASNRGIDDMRELKEKMRLAPSSFRYKVYIIDEVHMLTTEAFNALLKTLEEPPLHTLFVLCTTELHKVPETIVSRCVQIGFYKASADELERSLQRVVAAEGVMISQEVLGYLVTQVDGSFRDAVKLVEQVIALGDNVDLARVESVVFRGSRTKVVEWINSMLDYDTKKSLELVREAVAQGFDLSYFLVSAMQSLRLSLLSYYKVEEEPPSGIAQVPVSVGVSLIKKIDETARQLTNSTMPELLVEVMIVEWGESEGSSSFSSPLPSSSSEKLESDSIVSDKTIEAASLRGLWRKMLATMDKSQYSLEALLANASPLKIEEKRLIVSVAYDFHKTQLESSRFAKYVEKMVAKTFGMPLAVSYQVGKSDTIQEPERDIISEAEEIFVS